MAELLKHCLPPLIDKASRVLILGTLPGDESLRRQQYYGHPRNHFWPMLGAVFSEAIDEDYANRQSFLARRRLAIWDVLNSAERPGSLDTAIRSAVANDFSKLFDEHGALRAIVFNGQKAAALFRRHIINANGFPRGDIALIVCPSTSPAYVMALHKKTDAWRKAFSDLGLV